MSERASISQRGDGIASSWYKFRKVQRNYFKCILALWFNRGQNLMLLPNAGNKGKSLNHLTLCHTERRVACRNLCFLWTVEFFMSLWWQHGMTIECQKPAMHMVVNCLLEGSLVQKLNNNPLKSPTSLTQTAVNAPRLPTFPRARNCSSNCGRS